MSDLIDKKVLYNHFVDLEAVALEQVKKHMHDEDLTEWRIWSTILAERTAYKHDVFDAPVVDAEPVVRCDECIYRDGKTPGQPNILCWQMHVDDFCSYGTRMDERIEDG